VPTLAALTASAAVGAFLGPALAKSISDSQLERTILLLLVAIGLGVIVESLLPAAIGPLVDESLWLAVAIVAGLAIGLVSSLLGVAGGSPRP